jgi:hypothetical protein
VNILHRLRLTAAAALCLCVTIAAAQEPPVEAPLPPAEQPAPVEEPALVAEPAPSAAVPGLIDAMPPAEPPPAAEPAPVTEAAPAVETRVATETRAPRTGARRIVMLPVEFTVYQKSVAGVEAVPDWSETATFALGNAAIAMLSHDERFEVVDAPDFQGEARDLLREYVEFFKVVGSTALSMVQYGGKAWAEKATNFDYTLGDGLSFMADAADADYAFIINGSQVTQTGGSVFLQFLAAAGGYYTPGGGTYVMAGIVDLRDGRIAWLNSRMGAQVFGMTGSDMRKPETAAEVVAMMFEGFPENKLFKVPAF